jgi:hypothetical protein
MTNESILLPVAPHSEDSEFPRIDSYRGIVEDAVFDRLGRRSFFDVAVEVVMGRIAARITEKNLEVKTRGMRHWGATGRSGRQRQRWDYALRATVEFDSGVGLGRSF